jgi:hypothetical protein
MEFQNGLSNFTAMIRMVKDGQTEGTVIVLEDV